MPDFLSSRRIISLALLAASIAVFFLGSVNIPYLDRKADAYFRDSIKTSLITYGTLRTVNAVISFLQESDIQASPAGIGVSVAVGQVLDPVNDIVERGSNLLETSIMAIGALKILLELSKLFALKILACLLLISALITFFRISETAGAFLSKICLLLVILRLALPVAALANELLDRSYFDGQIQEHQENLKPFTAEKPPSLDQTDDLEDERNFLDTLKEALNPVIYLKKIKSSTAFLRENAGSIVSETVSLSILYLGKLLFQVLLIPILTFWFLLRIVGIVLKRDLAGEYEKKIRSTFERKLPDQEKDEGEGSAEGRQA